MNILIQSTSFHPCIGGIETLVEVLANEFHLSGHRVTVVTSTPDNGARSTHLPFTVLRSPSFGEFVRALSAHDVLMQANVSLPLLPALLFARRPWVATHHAWYAGEAPLVRVKEWLKRRLSLLASANVSVSHAVARHVRCGGTVIPNTYNDTVFRLMPEVAKDRDIVCLGRLVSDKGVKVLVEALGILKEHDQRPSLTIIGDGPERNNLEGQVARLGLEGQVQFTGALGGGELCAALNRHAIMVVPSIWDEPFGIVALEGIACGCVVVGSSGGGLPEAIGPCGATFPNGNAQELALTLGRMWRDPAVLDDLRSQAAAHLMKHKPGVIAEKYLDLFQTLVLQTERHSQPVEIA